MCWKYNIIVFCMSNDKNFKTLHAWFWNHIILAFIVALILPEAVLFVRIIIVKIKLNEKNKQWIPLLILAENSFEITDLTFTLLPQGDEKESIYFTVISMLQKKIYLRNVLIASIADLEFESFATKTDFTHISDEFFIMILNYQCISIKRTWKASFRDIITAMK